MASDWQAQIAALAGFLELRANELEWEARDWPTTLPPPPQGAPFWQDTQGHPIFEPRLRVLASVSSIRTTLRHYQWVIGGSPPYPATGWKAYETATFRGLAMLALAFAWHPDYRSEWSPTW